MARQAGRGRAEVANQRGDGGEVFVARCRVHSLSRTGRVILYADGIA
jgi:hypothetical protein